ncbi:serine hydrolase [Vreelandella arcis]|uniref:Beta-lactamase class A n=1 Tax=Vreelandella arcis TaxID=416873 RepID=A0A1H0IWN4_9GAMM|nr:serine hydrolase [Halomonas arcis]SDO35877.1 beta-lactamase class A [Halomonas arcis]
MRHWIQYGLVAVALLLALPAHADWYYEVDKRSAWQSDLNARLEKLEARFAGDIGVYVQNLASGEAYAWQADQPWYLASLIKVPVAAEVLGQRVATAERLTLTQSDYVDGAGPTNWHDPGTPISVGYLLEHMITVSDNTATDMLIDRVGLDNVNQRAKAMVAANGGNPDNLGPISKLVDVRQGVYVELHPGARLLGGMDFIALRQSPVSQRPGALAARLKVSPQALDQPDYHRAFDAYHASGENVGTLRAFGDLLATLYRGTMPDLQGPPGNTVLSLMADTSSGEQRLKQGLGDEVRFAHKTGTQDRRSCDAGIAERADMPNTAWAVVVCTQGPVAVSAHERALAGVGEALRYSGAIGKP